MSVANSTTLTKPSKPYPDFPLYAHASGRWAKKIRGRTHFFGPWADYHKALTKYLAEKDDLEAGRQPQRASAGVSDALTVKQMVGLYLDAKKTKVESGEMGEATWKLYESFGERMIRVFGAHTPVASLGPVDFQTYRADLQKTHKSLESIKGAICKTKAVFNWAGPGVNGQGFLDRLPRFGDAFRPPSPSAMQRQREEQGTRVFTSAQLRLLARTERSTERAWTPRE